MAKKHKKSEKKPPLPKISYNRDIPVCDFLEDYDLEKNWELGECLDNFISRIKRGYFLRWEAVVRDEQGFPLTEKQEESLDELISFSEDEDEPILYINGIARPIEPWYETINKVVPKLILDPFKTYEIYDEIYHEGWSMLVESLREYAKDLSLPEGITSPLEVITPDIRHRLWLQNCFDELSGLGQEEKLTLANEDQKPWRIKGFIDALKECKESVEYFDLTLEKLFELVKLLPEDEKILAESMMKELGMKSTSEKLYEVL